MDRTIFEKSRPGSGGATFHDREFAYDIEALYPNAVRRTAPLGLPDLTEVEVVRHYTRLSTQAHGVDNGCYPLGSCTMKYNPKHNDAMAGLDGFRHIHPHQPADTMSSLWRLMYELSGLIAELVGMGAVSLQPAAGAHGELAGLLYFESLGERRDQVVSADSAHGTNPSSAAMAGVSCQIIRTTPDGRMDIEALKEHLSPHVAALMLTNPSTP